MTSEWLQIRINKKRLTQAKAIISACEVNDPDDLISNIMSLKLVLETESIRSMRNENNIAKYIRKKGKQIYFYDRTS